MTSPEPNPLPDDLSYELIVLRKMLDQLPGRTGELINAQVIKVLDEIRSRYTASHNRLIAAVDDTILHVKLQEFDLEATKNERDKLQDRLDQIP